MALDFEVVATRRTELTPGNTILNIDFKTSYAEFLSLTKHLEKPYVARFERPDGSSFQHNVGFAKGVAGNANARVTMRNFEDPVPAGTIVTLLENA